MAAKIVYCWCKWEFVGMDILPQKIGCKFEDLRI
jgi:hypothetical protein